MSWNHKTKTSSYHSDGLGLDNVNLLVHLKPDPPKKPYRVIAFPKLAGSFSVTRHPSMEEALKAANKLLGA